jgi:hypothetical protein
MSLAARALLSDPCCLVLLVAGLGTAIWQVGGWIVRRAGYLKGDPR